MQEGDDGRGGRSYALPGGHVEFGETLGGAMSREFYEESGLNVEPEKLVYVHENFYTLKGLVTHEIGFYFLVDLNAAFPTPDAQGYIPSHEPHIRLRLLPLAKLDLHTVQPGFLRDRLPEDAGNRFAHPTLHVITRED
jgi:ADP-ribose pyrophosphatase YjhB (NUDIX family)